MPEVDDIPHLMTISTDTLHAVTESRWTSEEAWVGTRRPVHEAHALPADCYVDEAFFSQEQERVFATSWVCIGLHAELDAPGSAIVRTVAGRSVIVVEHRLSTVRDADQIAVMSQGVIADCGTHAELIERCDMYQTLVQRQMSGAPATAPE